MARQIAEYRGTTLVLEAGVTLFLSSRKTLQTAYPTARRRPHGPKAHRCLVLYHIPMIKLAGLKMQFQNVPPSPVKVAPLAEYDRRSSLLVALSHSTAWAKQFSSLPLDGGETFSFSSTFLVILHIFSCGGEKMLQF